MNRRRIAAARIRIELRSRMKMKSHTSEQSLQILTFVAANDNHIASAKAPVSDSKNAWDPYEIWRTRVLPYQSVLSAAAARANKLDATRK